MLLEQDPLPATRTAVAEGALETIQNSRKRTPRFQRGNRNILIMLAPHLFPVAPGRYYYVPGTACPRQEIFRKNEDTNGFFLNYMLRYCQWKKKTILNWGLNFHYSSILIFNVLVSSSSPGSILQVFHRLGFWLLYDQYTTANVMACST